MINSRRSSSRAYLSPLLGDDPKCRKHDTFSRTPSRTPSCIRMPAFDGKDPWMIGSFGKIYRKGNYEVSKSREHDVRGLNEGSDFSETLSREDSRAEGGFSCFRPTLKFRGVLTI
jgi:hypothetical protein